LYVEGFPPITGEVPSARVVVNPDSVLTRAEDDGIDTHTDSVSALTRAPHHDGDDIETYTDSVSALTRAPQTQVRLQSQGKASPNWSLSHQVKVSDC
jgi:hypothetical protein